MRKLRILQWGDHPGLSKQAQNGFIGKRAVEGDLAHKEEKRHGSRDIGRHPAAGAGGGGRDQEPGNGAHSWNGKETIFH